MDAVPRYTIQSPNPTTEYLQNIGKLYVSSAAPRSGGGIFNLVNGNQPQAGITSYLGMLMSMSGLGSNNVIHNTGSFNDSFNNTNTLDTTDGAALRDHNDFNGIFSGDVNDQITQQEHLGAQRQTSDEAQKAQAVAEAERLALEPKPDSMMDEAAFGQSRIRDGVLNKGTQPQQPLEVMKTIAQRAQSRVATLRHLKMPRRPGTQR